MTLRFKNTEQGTLKSLGGQKEHEAGGRHNGTKDREKFSSRILNIRLWRLPGEDSNLETRLQKPMCYHYTTGQDTGAREGSAHYAMLGSLLGSKINAGGVNFILATKIEFLSLFLR